MSPNRERHLSVHSERVQTKVVAEDKHHRLHEVQCMKREKERVRERVCVVLEAEARKSGQCQKKNRYKSDEATSRR